MANILEIYSGPALSIALYDATNGLFTCGLFRDVEIGQEESFLQTANKQKIQFGKKELIEFGLLQLDATLIAEIASRRGYKQDLTIILPEAAYQAEDVFVSIGKLQLFDEDGPNIGVKASHFTTGLGLIENILAMEDAYKTVGEWYGNDTTVNYNLDGSDHIIFTSASSANSYFYLLPTIRGETPLTLTFSADCKLDTGSGDYEFSIRLQQNDDSYVTLTETISLTDSYVTKSFTKTFPVGTDFKRIRLHFTNDGDEIYLKNPMLEIGPNANTFKEG